MNLIESQVSGEADAAVTQQASFQYDLFQTRGKATRQCVRHVRFGTNLVPTKMPNGAILGIAIPSLIES